MAQAPSVQVDQAFAADFFERLRIALNAGDVDAIVDFATDDVVYDDVGEDDQVHGKQAMSELLSPLFGAMEAVKVELLDSFIAMDRPAIGANWRFTIQRPDVDTLNIENMVVYTIRGGKACRWKTMYRHTNWMGDIWP